MIIVINSHNKSDIARNHLLDSIKQYDQYKSFKIIIVIGGYYSLPTYEITSEDNITYIKANHNSIDFTGLITLLELYSNNIDDYYFYMHDTCKVGPQFFEKISKINLENISSIKINRDYSMSMGIYSQRIINNNEIKLKEFKNTSENDIHRYKFNAVCFEDFIFNSDNNNRILDNFNNNITTGPTDYYKTGVMRITEYYSHLDLYKFKANWFSKNIYELAN